PRTMDSVLEVLEALDLANVSIPAVTRALGACSTHGCHLLLGAPPDVPPAPPSLRQDQWRLFAHLLHHEVGEPARGAVLAPDGSTVTLGPLFTGIEVGLKGLQGWSKATTEPPVDPLYAVTIAEALAMSFLLARGGNETTLGPGGCWDDVDNPQNYTLMGPSSPIPEAMANGAMDGVLLGAQLAQRPIGLVDLLRGYYGVANGTEKGRPPSSYRRREFRALVGLEKLKEEVVAMLEVLRVLPATQELLEDVGPEEVVAIAHQAAREFMEVYVDCPAIVPRCMWGARPYRGTPNLLTLPLDTIFIHHTFQPSVPCRNFSTCSRAMRSMQRFHQETRGWDDIGYSFVVGSDGYVYQGRGWHWVGAHTKGHNTRGYGVGYVGDFSTTLPDPDTIALVRDELLPCAVRTGRLHHNFTLRGHRQMGRTDCPGNALFQEIGTWQGFK
ncbi:PGRP2 amidase, partial [Centropus unirufus]|nr:PGRP2 amidase [Centropus unirufus]